jgi:LPXTG-motif cell wall-anchored protein
MVVHVWLAQTYGQGVYGCGQYGASCSQGTGVIQIGPLILPATGAGLIAIISAVLIAVGSGIFVWTRRRRKRAL